VILTCLVLAGDASAVFQITKFPTIKVILNGKIWRSEYRGRRVIEAFKKHIEDLLKDPSHEFFSLKELENLDVSLCLFFSHCHLSLMIKRFMMFLVSTG